MKKIYGFIKKTGEVAAGDTHSLDYAYFYCPLPKLFIKGFKRFCQGLKKFIVGFLALSLAFGPGVAFASTDTSRILISIPSTTALRNQQVSIPINISHNAQEIYGIDLWLTYNSSLLKVNDVNGVVAGTMTAGWSLVSNSSQAGVIKIGLYGSAALASGTGNLAVINFTVIGASGNCPLHVSKADFNETPVPAANITDGSFTVTQGPNKPPVFDINLGDKTISEGSSLIFNVVATDPDGDPITYLDAQYNSSTVLPAGAAFNKTNGVFSWALGYDQGGIVYPITFTVTDGKAGGIASKTINITVNDVPQTRTITASAGTGGSISPTGAVSVAYGGNQIFTVSVNTGYSLNQVLVDGVAVTMTGSTYTFTNVIATHTIAASFTQQRITVTVSSASGYPGQKDIPVNINVSDIGELKINGIDLELTYDANLLEVIQGGVITGNLTSGWSIVSNANEAGKVIIGLYNPNPLPSGPGSICAVKFNVKASAQANATSSLTLTKALFNEQPANQVNPGTFTVTASPNQPPVLASIGSKSVDEGQKLEFTISATDLNPNDVLIYSTGTLPAGAIFTSATRIFSWTPGFTQAGSYTARFTVSDGVLSDYEDVAITVREVNRAPILDSIGNKTAKQGVSLTFVISATDPDTDALTYSASVFPLGASFNATTRTFSWTPGAGQLGDFPATFNVTDGNLSDSESIVITVSSAGYTLSITTLHGTVTRSSDKATYNLGETVILTAIPDTGYAFSGWTGDVSSNINPFTVTMDSNKSITANFIGQSYILAINAVNGTVAKNPDKSAYIYNETVALAANPATGYHFGSWSGDASGTANPMNIAMTSNKNITANFVVNLYNLTVMNGSGSGTYTHGTQVKILAQSGPNTEGYTFKEWVGDIENVANPKSPDTTITMLKNSQVTAIYSKNSYTLAINAINGTVTKVPDLVLYDYGSTVRLTATANSGYRFNGWSGDLNGNVNPADIYMNSNKNVTANFVKNLANITASVSSASGYPGQAGVPVTISVNDIRDSQANKITLDLTYSASVLEKPAVELGSLTSGWSITSNTAETGRVIINLLSQNTTTAAFIGGAGSIAMVKFSVKANAASGATSVLTLNRALFNDQPANQLTPGTFTVVPSTNRPPRFVSSQPPDGSVVNSFNNIIFIFEDDKDVNEAANQIAVTRDGAAFTAFARNNSVNNKVTLHAPDAADGLYTFTIVPVDNEGARGATALVRLRLDRTPPVVKIIVPQSGIYTNKTSITVTYSIDGTVFNEETPLPREGRNVIVKTSHDQAGNTGSASIIIYRDTTPADVHIRVPAKSGISTNNPLLEVSGTVIEKGSGIAWLRVNGNTAGISGRSFSYTLRLQEGENLISVECLDVVGNQAVKRAVTIFLDTGLPVVPVLTSVTPTTLRNGKYYTTSRVVTINGTKENGTSIYVNGKKMIQNNSKITWRYSYALRNSVSGTREDQLSIYCKDAAGNQSSTVTLVIVFDLGYKNQQTQGAPSLISDNGTGTTQGSIF